MGEILVKVDGLSKKFCKKRYLSMVYGMTDVCKYLFSKKRSNHLRREEFFALQNISFELKRGESFGILGPNGAGKSTLLKLINGILAPDSGSIITIGKKTDVTTGAYGFRGELSGRENIYFRASLYKKGKREIDRLYNAIVEFSGIREFIDSPLKAYSSGMQFRLAFALAVHMKPDIIFLDSGSQFGDVQFIKKCNDILMRIRKDTIVVIASHNVDPVISLCNKILVLNKGNPVFIGKPAEAIAHYFRMAAKDDGMPTRLPNVSGDIFVSDIMLKRKGCDMPNICNSDDDVCISFKITPSRSICNYRIYVKILSSTKTPILKTMVSSKYGILEANEERIIGVYIDKLRLIIGKYYINVGLHDLDKNELMQGEGSFIVEDGSTVFPVNIDGQWE